MESIKIMINGLPGNVARMIATHAIRDARFEIIPYSLTGPEIEVTQVDIDAMTIKLITPQEREDHLRSLIKHNPPFITIDYTHPSAVKQNVVFYCRNNLPFVMGTTGGDRTHLSDLVQASETSAVIAPNMAKQIVGFQAMMDYAADNFPNLFKDYTLDIKESHQQGKADTSGTAKAMVRYFNKLGIPFTEEQIQQERDPERQKTEWHIPEHYLGGHAWHTYTLTSKDETVRFSFTHNINGREVYVQGTFDAVCYLNEKLKTKQKGMLYSMLDVLKAEY